MGVVSLLDQPTQRAIGPTLLVQLSGCHGEHCPDGLLCRNMSVVPVERAEHGEAAPGEAMVSPEKRAIP